MPCNILAAAAGGTRSLIVRRVSESVEQSLMHLNSDVIDEEAPLSPRDKDLSATPAGQSPYLLLGQLKHGVSVCRPKKPVTPPHGRGWASIGALNSLLLSFWRGTELVPHSVPPIDPNHGLEP